MKAIRSTAVETALPQEYVFENNGRRAETRYNQLSTVYDSRTIRHIKDRGIKEGWSCLEVGAGGGSIASWLCLRVGRSGRVLATEIEPRWLHALPHSNLEVWRHDIRAEGLPQQHFDLAHARLVLMHLPEREIALRRIIDSLKPGGWIVIEEFDCLSVFADPTINPSEQNFKARRAFESVLASRGVDVCYGRLLAHRLLANGLANVGAEATISLWGGNCRGTDVIKLNFYELREPMISAGLISAEEFDADLKQICERPCSMPSPMMWTAWGMKPHTDSNQSDTSNDFIYW